MAPHRLPLRPADLRSLRHVHLPPTATERPQVLAAVCDLVQTFHLAEPSGRLGYSEGDWTCFGPPSPLALDALDDARVFRGGVVQRAESFAYAPPVLFDWTVAPLVDEPGLVRFGFDLFYGAAALHYTRWRGLQHRHALFGRATVQPPR